MILGIINFEKFLKWEIFGNFPDWQFFEFSKSKTFRIFQIENCLNFSNRKFFEFSKVTIFRILQIKIFWSVQNERFSEFSKLEILEMFQIRNFWNCRNWKINKFVEFFRFVKPKFGSKNHSQFCKFSYLAFDMN